jgi:lysozyme family protein
MKEVFPHALKTILHHEGGWADHPKDPGGATMKGVTLNTYSKFIGRDATKDELKAISDEQLEQIYRSLYWNRAACDQLPTGVDLVVFDMAVNSGPGRAVKLLQEIVGSTPDGGIGPQTLTAVAKQNPLSLIKQYSEARRVFYKSLGAYITFGKGWLRRVDEVEAEAIKMQGSKA